MRRSILTTAALTLFPFAAAGGCKDSNTTIVFDASPSEGKAEVAATDGGAGDRSPDQGGTTESDAAGGDAADTGDVSDSAPADGADLADAEPGQ